MSRITISDLPQSSQLDRQAMRNLRGGASWLDGLGPVANVNVNVNQNIAQLQNIQVDVLNNVGVIGAGFGPYRIDVNPAQYANAGLAL